MSPSSVSKENTLLKEPVGPFGSQVNARSERLARSRLPDTCAPSWQLGKPWTRFFSEPAIPLFGKPLTTTGSTSVATQLMITGDRPASLPPMDIRPAS